MSLENFRKIKIRLDKAEQPIMQKQVVSEGDHNGRQLEVQLTNRYVIESQSGVSLNLFWRHLGKGNQGVEPFEVVSASEGIYQVSYPQAMLNAGTVDCFIQIMDGSNYSTNTRHFTVIVTGTGFAAQTVIASDDYKALTDALLTINQYQIEIDQIKQNLINQGDSLLASEKAEFDNLQANYAPLLQGLQKQFNETIAGVTIDSELITARTSTVTGKSHNTLSNHLDAIENRGLLHNLDSQKEYTMVFEIDGNKPLLRFTEVPTNG